MTPRFFTLIAIISIATALQSAQAANLYGMLQISRSDGLVAFYLLGTFHERTICEQELASTVGPFIDSAQAAGYEAQVGYAICDNRIPAGTSYEALHDTHSANHYIFYTPNMRLMMVHERGSLEYERQICEHMRGEFLQSLGISADCLAPLQND